MKDSEKKYANNFIEQSWMLIYRPYSEYSEFNNAILESVNHTQINGTPGTVHFDWEKARTFQHNTGKLAGWLHTHPDDSYVSPMDEIAMQGVVDTLGIPLFAVIMGREFTRAFIFRPLEYFPEGIKPYHVEVQIKDLFATTKRTLKVIL